MSVITNALRNYEYPSKCTRVKGRGEKCEGIKLLKLSQMLSGVNSDFIRRFIFEKGGRVLPLI